MSKHGTFPVINFLFITSDFDGKVPVTHFASWEMLFFIGYYLHGPNKDNFGVFKMYTTCDLWKENCYEPLLKYLEKFILFTIPILTGMPSHTPSSSTSLNSEPSPLPLWRNVMTNF